MDAQLMAVVAAGVGVAVGAGGAVVALRGKLKAAQTRTAHLEQQRLQAAQQTSVARRQVETLQKEVAELRQLLANTGTAAPARKNPGLEGLQNMQLETPDVEVPGFAKTQLIARGDR